MWDKIELNNGLSAPLIGGGTFPYKQELETIIPQMVEIGFRLFDTSDNYDNEQHLGKALSKLSRSELESLTIVTKYSRPLVGVKEAFEQSAQKLFKETCMPERKPDVYLMHWPYPHLWRKRWHEMEELYLQGECKAIGVCNFTDRYLEKLLASCEVKPSIDQFECHPMFQQRNTIDLCEKEGIQVMSYSPFARMNKTLFDNDVLKNIAAKHGKSVGQVILNWNICEGRIPIPASANRIHNEENYGSLDFQLSMDEIEDIDKLENGMRIRYDPDTRFSSKQKLVFGIKALKMSLFHK